MHIISGDLWAGAEAMAYQLLSGLNKLDRIDLYLIILNKGRLELSCRQLGIKTFLVNERTLPATAIAGRVIRIARKIKPDIIHAHRYKENILAASMAGFCGRPKLVATQHGRSEADNPSFRNRIISRLNHACLQRIFTEVVAVSKDTAEYLLHAGGLKQRKLTIIPNGITVPLTPRVMKDTGNDRPFTIGSAGRLFPVKRFDALIEIARQVCRVKSQTRFVIAGEGPERKKLMALIARYELNEQVQLLGHVEDMPAFYNGLDLYINTSLHEGTPMSILEAMAGGLPVIAFRVAGLKEIITDSKDGFTIPADDTILFASRIIELINNSKYLNELGLSAYKKIIDHFSTTKMVEGYRALYYRMLRTA
ncbi:MAG: glycosyltransferase family 1 protein [Desulfobacteraceae bacterium]|jgi:glycosyltransferase involved in cell wall biosynthesis|nr:MAG: glycosyltransferase family 1 protein [Desulfobacteraceae bacterium]